jgi:hypothetical protein
MDFERDAATYNPNYEGSREQAARNSPLRLDESYDSGKQALEYVLTVLRSIDGVRPEALAASILNLGDWHLAYGKVAAAKRTYREANDSLLAAGFSAQAIEQALSTELPLRIPVFAIHPYTRGSRGTNVDADFTPRGYVDVRYTVDELGNAHSVEILSESSEEDSIVQRSLALQLRSIKFRPVIRNGDLYAYGQVDTRYYYSY